MVLLELQRDSRVMTGNLGFLLLALKSNLPFGLRGGTGFIHIIFECHFLDTMGGGMDVGDKVVSNMSSL